jgi:hypothetical protein
VYHDVKIFPINPTPIVAGENTCNGEKLSLQTFPKPSYTSAGDFLTLEKPSCVTQGAFGRS